MYLGTHENQPFAGPFHRPGGQNLTGRTAPWKLTVMVAVAAVCPSGSDRQRGIGSGKVQHGRDDAALHNAAALHKLRTRIEGQADDAGHTIKRHHAGVQRRGERI